VPFQGVPSRMIALRMVSSLRATAMMATFLGLPAALRRSKKALMTYFLLAGLRVRDTPRSTGVMTLKRGRTPPDAARLLYPASTERGPEPGAGCLINPLTARQADQAATGGPFAALGVKTPGIRGDPRLLAPDPDPAELPASAAGC